MNQSLLITDIYIMDLLATGNSASLVVEKIMTPANSAMASSAMAPIAPMTANGAVTASSNSAMAPMAMAPMANGAVIQKVANGSANKAAAMNGAVVPPMNGAAAINGAATTKNGATAMNGTTKNGAAMNGAAASKNGASNAIQTVGTMVSGITSANSGNVKYGGDSYMDMHMNMCLSKQVKSMSDPESCVAYLSQRMYEKGKTDSTVMDMTIGDMKKVCQKVDQLPLHFFVDLCKASNEGMAKVWKDNKDFDL